MRVGEFGIDFIFAAGIEMLDATYLALRVEKPDGSQILYQTPDITLGQADIYTTAGYLRRGTYVVHRFAQGEVDQAGTWTVQLIYQNALPKQLISEPVTFIVEA